MWEPDPEWTRVPGGRGTLTVGVWRARRDGHDCVVKRVRRPAADEPEGLWHVEHPGYWRREAEVALAGLELEGLVPTKPILLEEDDEGYVIWTEWAERQPVTALFAARALGRFAVNAVPDVPWLSRSLLTTRMALAAGRGGWPTLARTTAADLADELWSRGPALLARYDALPQRLSHGDAVPGNLIAPRGADVVALDWASLGTAPAGADLGYYALSAREDFDVLVTAYASEVREDLESIRFAADVMAVLTVVSQAEWALARVAGGEGALAGKFRHPSVSPYLHALQRQFPQIERLLGT